MATSKSTELEVVDKTPVLPPGHLNDEGHIAVRPPVPSCVKNQLMVCPSFALERTGAAVMLAVIVTVNTLDRAQSTAIEDAAKDNADGLVWAAPSTVMTPEANKESTELEPALNFPIAALVELRLVIVPLVIATRAPLTVVKLAEPYTKVVPVRVVIAPLAPRI